MKILLVTNMYPNMEKPYLGVFVKRQVEALEKEGIEIVVIARPRDTVLSYIPFLIFLLYRLLFTTYDIVHTHYGFHSALIPSILKIKKLIITFHGSDALVEPFRSKLYFYLQKYVINRADHIISVSNDIKNTLVNKLDADPSKISIISCGVNTSKFSPMDKNEVRKQLGIREKAIIVLFVGKIEFMKGVDILYECATGLDEYYFIFVGDGHLKSNLKNCVFVGPQLNDEMPKWMNAADIFVLPSRTEGTPVVLLEAMSCGTPVIASRVGGCPDLIREGETGYLVPVGDSRVLLEKIQTLAGVDSKRKSMGIECRKNVIKKYDNKIIACNIIGVYQKCVSV